MIKRFGMDRDYANNVGVPAIVELPDGKYVLHADYLAELASVERMAAAQTVTIAELRGNYTEIPNSSIGAPDATLSNEGTKAVLPKLPMPIYKHPLLGELYDRLAMHMYAVGHGDQVAAQLGVPDGWKLVPTVPTESMVVCGFESAPNEFFSPIEEWERYEAMSGCQQAAYCAEKCWAAMLEAAPTPPADGQTQQENNQ